MKIKGAGSKSVVFALLILFGIIVVPTHIFAQDDDPARWTAHTSAPRGDIFSFTGAASAEIPILTSPGRNGIQPNLSIVYNSYAKNGPLGMGWMVDMGAIQRSTKHGVDYSLESEDFVYVVNGLTTELVPVDEWGENFYGEKIESLFTKYYFNPIAGGWEATTRDGIRYHFGSTSDSRQDFVDGSSNVNVFKWCLDRVEDTNGNYMTVSYFKDQGEIYPEWIRYTYHHPEMTPENYDAIFVRFYWESSPDVQLRYSFKFEIRTAYRLKTIEVKAGGGQPDQEPVRAYKLTYTDSGMVPPQSLLVSAQQFGSDYVLGVDENNFTVVTGGSSLPAMTMVYNNGDDNGFDYQANPPDLDNEGWIWDDDADAEYSLFFPGDYNGDAKTDILRWTSNQPAESRAKFFVARGTNGEFDESVPYPPYLLDDFLYDILNTGDFNADARTDILKWGHVNLGETRRYLSILLPNGGVALDGSTPQGDIMSHGWSGNSFQNVTVPGDYNGVAS